MTRTVLVAGTASHVGKSTVAAGMCRLLADRGVDVAPFKAQNMSNNARAVATPDGGFGEIGVSQYVQARAARIHPTTDVNPVLLKPRGGGESQLVVHGEAVGHFRAGEYYDRHWERAREAAVESYERLAAVHDVVVAEGAGSAAEINLHDRDLANVETARFPERVAAKRGRSGEAPEPRSTEILLVVDIERGGAFASLVGTLELMPEDLSKRVIGVVINKFRGDRSLLVPGIEQFEAKTGVPVVGVLPYDDPGLPAEDSVSLPPEGERSVSGQDDTPTSVTVAVPRLPHISNFTDFGPLAREPGVRVAWVPLDDPLDGSRRDDVGSLEGPHAVVLPGTKNTVADLVACRDAGLGRALREFNGPVVGLCGGYQMLGKRIRDAGVEATWEVDEVEGFDLLPIETRFSRDKRVERVTRELRRVGPLASAGATPRPSERSGGQSAQTLGQVTGYEIHMGETELTGPAERPFPDEGAAAENILGTYLHGLFENQVARDAFVEAVFAAAGCERPTGSGDQPAPPDLAAALLAEHLDLDALALPDE